MFNNLCVIEHLPQDRETIPRRRTVNRTPCLLSRLPNVAFLQREGELWAAEAFMRRVPISPSTIDSPETIESGSERGDQSPRMRRLSIVSTSTDSKKPLKAEVKLSQWKEPQVFEVFRAVERKDIMFL